MNASPVINWIARRDTQKLRADTLPSLQCPPNRRKGEFIPGDPIRREQLDVQTLDPGREIRLIVLETRTENHLHLGDASDGENAEYAIDGDGRGGFFQRLSRCAFLQRFTKLQVTGGKCPKAFPWLDGAPAHQDGSIRDNNRADDDLWILVRDMAAIRTNHALAVVTFGNTSDKQRHCAKLTPSASPIKP